MRVWLQANSERFRADLQQLGNVFFPGAQLLIWTPESPADSLKNEGEIASPADPDRDGGAGEDGGTGWRVVLSAYPAETPGGEEGDWPPRLWRVEVAAQAPDGRRVQRAETVPTDPAEGTRAYEHRIRHGGRRMLVAALGELTGVTPGWGILTGVRPTKRVHDFLDRGLAPAAVRERLAAEYRVQPEKIDLVMEVALRQRPFLHHAAAGPGQYDPRAVSIYIGIPYCPTICSFCSFSIYSAVQRRHEVPQFLQALYREMAMVGEAVADLGLRVESLYLGGGTPTSPADPDFAALLQRIEETLLRGQRPREYTVEGGRPETFNRFKLDAMAAAGVTRVSVNPQTTNQTTLRHLGRIHTVEKFYRAYDLVRRHPHPFVVNTDVIVGLPGEGSEEVLHTLADMRRLDPENLTVHTLAVKRGSRLHEAGEAPTVLQRLTPAEAAALVAEAARTARSMGQHPYYLYRQKYMVGSLENVGYARPGTESIYNIQMMERRQTVIGLGAGATSAWYHGPSGWLLKAPANPNDPTAYMARVEELAAAKVRALRLLYAPNTAMPVRTG